VDRNAFVKSHALGNDYLIIDPQALSFPLTERTIRLICDRHRGVGSDGILTPVPPVKADFGLRIFNPDGSEAEKSGNGLRIFARYLYDHGLTRKTQFTVETAGGVVAIRLHLRGTAVDRITVEMGRATFHSERIPVTGPPREVIDEAVDVDGQSLAITAVSMGNPHCVVFVPDLHRVDLHHTAILHHDLNRAMLDAAQRGERRTHDPVLLRTQCQVLGRGAHRALGAVTHTGLPHCLLILSDLLARTNL